MSATILGTGSYLPGPSVTNQELGARFGRHVIWLAEMLGAGSRHFAIDLDTGELRDGASNAQMASEAARQALANASIASKDIDLLVLATSTPDYPFPATALFVQEQLDIENCSVMELRAGCGGTAQAFAVATSLIQVGSARHALLIGSELISPFLSLYEPKNRWDKAFLASLSMFADGAGAVVLGPAEADEVGIQACMFRSLSTGRKPGLMMKVGGAIDPRGATYSKPGRWEPFVQDTKAIERHTPELTRAALDWLHREIGIEDEDVDTFIGPQPNTRLSRSVVKAVGLPQDKVFSNFERVGNTSSASIYIALDELNRAGRLEPGHRLVLLPAEATKWTYGGVALQWEREVRG